MSGKCDTNSQLSANAAQFMFYRFNCSCVYALGSKQYEIEQLRTRGLTSATKHCASPKDVLVGRVRGWLGPESTEKARTAGTKDVGASCCLLFILTLLAKTTAIIPSQGLLLASNAEG